MKETEYTIGPAHMRSDPDAGIWYDVEISDGHGHYWTVVGTSAEGAHVKAGERVSKMKRQEARRR